MQEDDIFVLAPTALTDQGDQASKSLARIDRIEWKTFEPARKSNRFDRRLVRDAVGRPRVTGDDFPSGPAVRYAPAP